MTEKINGKEVVGQIIVQPDANTKYIAKILKCTCPAKAGLEVHPLSQPLSLMRGLTPDQAVELIKQQGWAYKMSWAVKSEPPPAEGIPPVGGFNG